MLKGKNIWDRVFVIYKMMEIFKQYDYDKNQTLLDDVDERLIAGLYLNQKDLQLLQAEQKEDQNDISEDDSDEDEDEFLNEINAGKNQKDKLIGTLRQQLSIRNSSKDFQFKSKLVRPTVLTLQKSKSLHKTKTENQFDDDLPKISQK